MIALQSPQYFKHFNASPERLTIIVGLATTMSMEIPIYRWTCIIISVRYSISCAFCPFSTPDQSSGVRDFLALGKFQPDVAISWCCCSRVAPAVWINVKECVIKLEEYGCNNHNSNKAPGKNGGVKVKIVNKYINEYKVGYRTNAIYDLTNEYNWVSPSWPGVVLFLLCSGRLWLSVFVCPANNASHGVRSHPKPWS